MLVLLIFSASLLLMGVDDFAFISILNKILRLNDDQGGEKKNPVNDGLVSEGRKDLSNSLALLF